jgi:hypothetical protein
MNSNRGLRDPSPARERLGTGSFTIISVKKLALFLLVLLAVAAVYYPLHVIHPFKRQEEAQLLFALAVKKWSPLLTAILAFTGLIVGVRIWKERGTWKRLGVAFALLLLGVSAAASRINIYELMFKPVPSAGFIPALEAKYEPKDMVMSVQLDGQIKAWPVRTMGYHHIFNDELAGQPLVVTY